MPRPKGSLNKITSEIKEKIADMVSNVFETLDTNTFSIPCCQYTLPRCAIIGSPTLIEGDGFHALMVNPVGEPWEDCEQYNEETCVGDVDGDGIVTVSDLLLYLSDPYVGTGDLEGIIQNFGNQCN
jgi:hypothetical protein